MTNGALGAEGRTALTNAVFKALSVPVEKASRLVLAYAAMHVLSAAAFGTYNFAAAVTLFLSAGTDLGLSIWTTRALARDRRRAGAIVGTALRLKAAAALPYFAAVGLAAVLVGPGEPRAVMMLLGATALFGVFVDYFIAVFRGYERLRDEALVNVIRSLLITGAALLALRAGRSATALAAGLTIGTVLSCGAGLWLVAARYRLVGRRAGPGPRFDRALARTAVRQALPLCLATLLSLLYFRGDVVLLRPYAGDAAVGAYSAAYKIFEGLMIVPAVVLAAAFPPLARAHLDRERQRRWEVLLVTLLLGLGLAAGAVVYLARAQLVALVASAAFAAAVPSLRVLALAIPVLYLNYGLTHFLIARDLERRNVLFAGLMLVVNVAANLLLIPRFGGPGAAWATLATELVLTGCCFVALRAGSRAAARGAGAAANAPSTPADAAE
jgi:O-antigen/teichoic acid export membrane protein